MSDRRERVLVLARQIEDLSHPNTDEGKFFSEFLKRLLTAIGAPAGIIWTKGAIGDLDPRAEQGLSVTGYSENPEADQMNASLLREVMDSGKSMMFGAGEPTEMPTPTKHLYVFTPLLVGPKVLGVVEVIQRPDTDPRARPGYLQFIEQMCRYAARYIYAKEKQA